MTLVLYQHPFASYCQKVLVALYELELPFDTRLVEDRDELLRVWPMGGMPVLLDGLLVVPESTMIIEHLDRLAGGDALVPAAAGDALQARLWDRFADQHLSTPMQKIVGDELRPDGERDAYGVTEARESLDTAYGVLDAQLADQPWAGGARFTIADCAAFPPLFYLRAIHRWDAGSRPNVDRYYRELASRPSIQRVVEEARGYRELFPFPWPADQDV